MAASEPDDDDAVDAEDGGLIVELSIAHPVAVVRIVGEIDIGNAGQVREVATRALDREATTLVFDLGGVTFMDSSAITVLLEAASSAPELLIRTPSIAARRIIEVTGLTDVLRIEP